MGIVTISKTTPFQKFFNEVIEPKIPKKFILFHKVLLKYQSL